MRLTDNEMQIKEKEIKDKLFNLVDFNYPVIVEGVTIDGEFCYKLTIDELKGLSIYVDDVNEGMKDLREAKIEWLQAAIGKDASFLLIPNYSKSNK